MPIDISKTDGIIAILILFSIVNFNYEKLLIFIKNSKLFLNILLLSFLILLSYLWSTNDSTVVQHLRYSEISQYYYRYMIFFFLPLIMIILNIKKEFIPLLINSFIAGMFINVILSYGIFFELWVIPYTTPSNPVPYHGNHITYSTFLGFTILLSFYKLNHIKNNYAKAFYLLLMITMIINLFMTAGRTGQFSLLITSIILLLIYFRTNIKMLILSFLILFMTFLLAYTTMATFNKRVNKAFQDTNELYHGKNVDTSLGTRIMSYHSTSYLMNKNNILFGVGMGDKPYYVSKTLTEDYPYRLVNFDKYGYLHNSHVGMLVSNGIVGLFFYLSIFYFLFKVPIKNDFIKYISYSLSIYFLCYGANGDIFYPKELMPLFAFFLGIVILQSQLEKKTIDG